MSNPVQVFYRDPDNFTAPYDFMGSLPGGGEPMYTDLQEPSPDVTGCMVQFTVDRPYFFDVGILLDVQFVYPASSIDETNEVTDINSAKVIYCEPYPGKTEWTVLKLTAAFVPTH